MADGYAVSELLKVASSLQMATNIATKYEVCFATTITDNESKVTPIRIQFLD
jgi:hypothetical protein